MKILVLVDWVVHDLKEDSLQYQPANKNVAGMPYWFFKYWPGDHEIDVIDWTQIPGIHFVEKYVLKTYLLQTVRAISKLHKYDLVISHGARSALLPALWQTVLRQKSPPHIHIDVGSFNGGRVNRKIETGLIKYAARSLSAIIYHARIQEAYYKKHMPFLADRARYVPFGYDTDFFLPLDGEPQNYIISVGHYLRDFQTLVKAWREMVVKDTRLKIVGVSNPKAFGIDPLTMPKNIDVIPYVRVAELKKLIGGARFVVLPLPYLEHSIGQKTLLESMAMEKAVIVTKTPGTEDYVTDFETGVFVESDNSEDLRAKICLLLENTDLTAKLASRAAETVKYDFPAEKMALGIYQAAKSALNDPARIERADDRIKR